MATRVARGYLDVVSPRVKANAEGSLSTIANIVNGAAGGTLGAFEAPLLSAACAAHRAFGDLQDLDALIADGVSTKQRELNALAEREGAIRSLVRMIDALADDIVGATDPRVVQALLPHLHSFEGETVGGRNFDELVDAVGDEKMLQWIKHDAQSRDQNAANLVAVRSAREGEESELHSLEANWKTAMGVFPDLIKKITELHKTLDIKETVTKKSGISEEGEL